MECIECHTKNINLLLFCKEHSKITCLDCSLKSHKFCTRLYDPAEFCKEICEILKSQIQDYEKYQVPQEFDTKNTEKILEEIKLFIDNVRKIMSTKLEEFTEKLKKELEIFQTKSSNVYENIYNLSKSLSKIIEEKNELLIKLKEQYKNMRILQKDHIFDFEKLLNFYSELNNANPNIKIRTLLLNFENLFTDFEKLNLDYKKLTSIFSDNSQIIKNEVGIQTCKKYAILGTPFSSILNLYDPVKQKSKKIQLTIEKSKNFILPSKCTILQGDGIIYFIGGCYSLDKAENQCSQYSFFTKKVKIMDSLNYARRNHTAIYCENSVFCIGGNNESDILNSCEKYDTDIKKWVILPCINYARTELNSVYLNKKIYIIGGNNPEKSLEIIEFLDVSEKESKWEILKLAENIDKNWSGRFSVGLLKMQSKNQILIFGGKTETKEFCESFILDLEKMSLQISDKLKLPQSGNFEQKEIFLDPINNDQIILESKANDIFIFNEISEQWKIIKFDKWHLN